MESHSEMLDGKLNKTIGILIRKNEDNYFQSNTRYIFL